MTDFNTAHEHLTAERDAGNYSDAVHIDPEVAAAYATLIGADAWEWPDWIDAADAAYRGSWGDIHIRPEIDPVDSTYSVVAGYMFRVK